MAVASVAALGCLTACASSDSSSGSGSAKTAAATIATSGCGSLPGALPSDPDGALAALSTDLQKAYGGLKNPVLKSAWADTKPAAGPWKIGYTAFPTTNSINVEYLTQLRKRFATAKAAGLVTGSLDEQILPDPTSMTPAQQIQLYQTMVRHGDNAIMMQPLSPESLTKAVTEAGEKGIVSASFTPIASPYAVTTQASFYQDAGTTTAAILNQLGGKGNVLVIRGIPGVAPDTDGWAAIQAALKECPDVKLVGSVNAQFTDPTAKSAMQTYLASHPGKIDAVLTTGGVSTGVINAFQAAGRPIPLVAGNGATAGFFSYWGKNKAKWSSAATVGSPTEQADAVWDGMMRTLAGNGPKVNIIGAPSVLVNSDNFADFVQSGKPETSSDILPPVSSTPYLDAEYLDQFFTTPGQPDKK